MLPMKWRAERSRAASHARLFHMYLDVGVQRSVLLRAGASIASVTGRSFFHVPCLSGRK